jgi:hypothetical protein
MDEYRDPKTGHFCPSLEVAIDELGDVLQGKEAGRNDKGDIRLSLWRCYCGRVISVMVNDDWGLMPYSCPEWEGVDWEDEDNSYPGD